MVGHPSPLFGTGVPRVKEYVGIPSLKGPDGVEWAPFSYQSGTYQVFIKMCIRDSPIAVYDWGIDVNLKGQFYFCHAASRYMRRQKSGLIVNIGSITGMEGDGYGVDYPTAKSGVMFGLTKSVAQYGSQYGFRCVCVSPGPVLTKMCIRDSSPVRADSSTALPPSKTTPSTGMLLSLIHIFQISCPCRMCGDQIIGKCEIC